MNMTHAARRLGPLPGRTRTFNSTHLTAGARQAFLSAGVGTERRGGVVSGVRPEATPKAQSWYRFENYGGPDPELYLYGEIGCWGITASDLIEELKYVTAPALTVHLSSPGGEIFEGIAVYNALRSHPSAITIRVDSIAASIASVILQAGDTRIMQPFSQAMIHEGSGLCWGNAAEMVEMATLLDKQSDNIAAVYAERAGGTPEAWRELMRAESWFTADEAVAAGLADEVDAAAPEQPDPAQAAPAAQPAAMWDLTGYKHAGRQDAPAPLLNTTPPEPATAAQAPQLQGEHGPELLDPPTADTPAVTNEVPAADPEPVVVPAAEPIEPAVAPAAAADNEWAASVARLMTPPPSADDEFTRLKEALL